VVLVVHLLADGVDLHQFGIAPGHGAGVSSVDSALRTLACALA
jgi:hypothetical protein